MKYILTTFVGVITLFGVVWCYTYQECRSWENALQDIDYELNQEARKHNFYFPYGRLSYISKTKHVLKELNTKIKQKQQSRVSPQCTALENAIKVKSVNYGLEIEGLEDGVTRFEKLITFLDERNQNQRNDTDRKQVVSQQIAEAYVELQGDLSEANATIARLNQTNTELMRNYQVLQKEYHKILAKLHANAAAIHGKTGNITGLHNETSTIKPEQLNLPGSNNVSILTNSTDEAAAPSKTNPEASFEVDVRANNKNTEKADSDDH